MSKVFLTNEVLSHCLAIEYPTAKAWENYWVGHLVNPDDPTVQHQDSEILEWEVPDIPKPTGDVLLVLIAKHKDSYREPVAEALTLTPELVETIEDYLRQRDKER